MSTMLPITLMATPSVPVVLERVDVRRLMHLFSAQGYDHRQPVVVADTSARAEVQGSSAGGASNAMMASHYHRRRRSSLPLNGTSTSLGSTISGGGGLEGATRHRTRRASIINEARHELKGMYR